MSVFASLVKTSNRLNLTQLKSELESSLPGKLALDYGPGNSTIAVSSAAQVTSQSFTCEADDIVDVDFAITVSSTAGVTGADISFGVDGAYPRTFSIGAPKVNSNGRGEAISCRLRLYNLTAGSHTADIYFSIYGGSGTIYSQRQFISVWLSKRRA